MTYPHFPRSTAQAFPRTCEAACAVTHYRAPRRWQVLLWAILLGGALLALYSYAYF